MASLREIVLEYENRNQGGQAAIIDNLTESSPILDSMPFEAASHGIYDVYEELNETDSLQVTDLNEGSPEVDANFKWLQKDLNKVSGIIKCPEDTATAYGGFEKYVAKKLPPISRQTGMNIEKSILYNNLRAYSILNETDLSAGSAVANKNYSIIAVTWVTDVVAGLYSEDMMSRGNLFELTPLANGSLHNIGNDSAGNAITGYAARLRNYLGMKIASSRYIASIVNIHLDLTTPANTKIPTLIQLEDMLDTCRANEGGRTAIYMHPKVKRYLQAAYKDDFLQMNAGDGNLNLSISTFGGIPIVTSRNFLNGTEAVVS